MVSYQHIIRYQPGHAYPASDAGVLADELSARLCATVFYRSDIPAPVGGRKGLLDIQGGGAFATSGRPLSTLDENLATSSQFHFLARAFNDGHAVVSLGYVTEILIGQLGDANTPATVYFATTAAADAAIPGRGAFDPSQWKYTDAGKLIELDSTIINRYSAEHCAVHVAQWIATFGELIGLSTDLAADWLITGRSFGAHLGQFLALGCDRRDPDAGPSSRYAKSTRFRGVINLQNVSTWNIYQGSTFIPHWTDYSGALIKTIGGAKAVTGPGGEDQIDLASALYHAFQHAPTAEANATVPVFLLAGDGGITGNPGFTYANFETFNLNVGTSAHPKVGVLAMELALKALTPPSGEANVHLTVSQFVLGPLPGEDVTAAILAFMLPLLELDEEPPEPTPGATQGSTAKFSKIDVLFKWPTGQLAITTQRGGFGEYVGVPDLAVMVPIDAPGIVQDPCRIDCPDSIELFAELANGRRYPKIDVTVTERRQDAAGVTYDTRVLWAGHVDVSTRAPKGRSGRVLLECSDELSLTETAVLGIQASDRCQHTFGRGLCRSATTNINDLIQDGQIQAISGSNVTIAGLTPGAYPTYYQHGYIEREGIRIGVRNWTEDAPTSFVLRDQPPADWLLATVQVAPGCDKTVPNCVSYANSERFMGPGLVMPEYAPHYQQSPK